MVRWVKSRAVRKMKFRTVENIQTQDSLVSLSSIFIWHNLFLFFGHLDVSDQVRRFFHNFLNFQGYFWTLGQSEQTVILTTMLNYFQYHFSRFQGHFFVFFFCVFWSILNQEICLMLLLSIFNLFGVFWNIVFDQFWRFFSTISKTTSNLGQFEVQAILTVVDNFW